jgi:hypothetical protein
LRVEGLGLRGFRVEVRTVLGLRVERFKRVERVDG